MLPSQIHKGHPLYREIQVIEHPIRRWLTILKVNTPIAFIFCHLGETILSLDSGDSATAKILSEVHNMLHTLVKRVEGTEKELKEIKRHISTPSSSDSGAKKKEVPNIVRVNLCSFCLGHRNLLTCIVVRNKKNVQNPSWWMWGLSWLSYWRIVSDHCIVFWSRIIVDNFQVQLAKWWKSSSCTKACVRGDSYQSKISGLWYTW